MDISCNPFFILGAPRSGTTILRDILRQHPLLAAPEETHFYRWSYPFKSKRFTQLYEVNPTLKHHRKIDEIDDDVFWSIYNSSTSRKEIQNKYMQCYLDNINKKNARWFDKTPQNVYGILMLHADYPNAKFIHIHRNPLNVVASLMRGEVMHQQTLHAAINWWMESVNIVNTFSNYSVNSVLHIKYESLVSAPNDTLNSIARHIILPKVAFDFNTNVLRPERNDFAAILSDDQIEFVLTKCFSLMDKFGYNTNIKSYL